MCKVLTSYWGSVCHFTVQIAAYTYFESVKKQLTNLWTNCCDCWKIYDILGISECISRYCWKRYHITQQGSNFASFQIANPNSWCPKVCTKPIKRLVTSFPVLSHVRTCLLSKKKKKTLGKRGLLIIISYWQNIDFSRNCPKFHKFTGILIFQV